jgi:pilus assembly protein Flp/PilA
MMGIFAYGANIKKMRRNENMSFFKDDGQGLLEYALVLILVAVVVIAIITLLGPEISARLCPYLSVFCTA